ncbi:hypothetical protein NADFUDRAFT_65912 [Nadsonia fulvescens var. elongata DSM 6958]|uniref:Uncharacterized protein n=1 Tax=Nadsonia fulvescens var. elongata DSM 6958 TaxID=857566 RepID=A0A1E3PKZ5_9ASCO|nr:hypothetical protein NADFUDRAFT_65912 [Nadsonia fulvescens var. elongata DSM 6958]
MNNLRTPLEKVIPSVLSTYYASGDPIPTRPVSELNGKRLKIIDFNYNVKPAGYTLASVVDNKQVAITVAFPYETCQRYFNISGESNLWGTIYRIFDIKSCQLSFYHQNTLEFIKQNEEITESDSPLDSFKIMLIVHDFEFLTIPTNHSSPGIQYVEKTVWFISSFDEFTLKRSILVKRRRALKEKCNDIIKRTMSELRSDIQSLKQDFAMDSEIIKDLQSGGREIEVFSKYIPILQARKNSYFELTPKPAIDVTNEDQVINICLQDPNGIDSLIKLDPRIDKTSRFLCGIYPNPPSVIYHKVKPTLDTNKALIDYAADLFDNDSDDKSEEENNEIIGLVKSSNTNMLKDKANSAAASGDDFPPNVLPENPTPAPVVIKSTYGPNLKTITKANTRPAPVLMPTFVDDDDYDDESIDDGEYNENSEFGKDNEAEGHFTVSARKTNSSYYYKGDAENIEGSGTASSVSGKVVSEDSNGNSKAVSESVTEDINHKVELNALTQTEDITSTKMATSILPVMEANDLSTSRKVVGGSKTAGENVLGTDIRSVNKVEDKPLPNVGIPHPITATKDTVDITLNADCSIENVSLSPQRHNKRKWDFLEEELSSNEAGSKKIWIIPVNQSSDSENRLNNSMSDSPENSEAKNLSRVVSDSSASISNSNGDNRRKSVVKKVIHKSALSFSSSTQESTLISASQASTLEFTSRKPNTSDPLPKNSVPVDGNTVSRAHSSPLPDTPWKFMNQGSKNLEPNIIDTTIEETSLDEQSPAPVSKSLSQRFFNRFLGERKK